MTGSRRRRFALGALFAPVPSHADDDVLRRFNDAYYRAKDRGLGEFRCDVLPNWNMLLGEQPDNDKAKAARAVLDKIHMTLRAGPYIRPEIGHSDFSTGSETVDRDLQGIYSGIERTMVGFFTTYAIFMFESPLPAKDHAYTLKPDGAGWTLTFPDGPGEVLAVIDQDLKISKLVTTAPAVTGTLKPRFASSSDGFLLSHYNASYTRAPDLKMDMVAGITYQRVDTFRLPNVISLSGRMNGAPFDQEIALTNCHATTHDRIRPLREGQ